MMQLHFRKSARSRRLPSWSKKWKCTSAVRKWVRSVRDTAAGGSGPITKPTKLLVVQMCIHLQETLESGAGFIDKWMSGDCLGRRVNGTKVECTNGNFLGFRRMILKNSTETTFRLLSEITLRNMFLAWHVYMYFGLLGNELATTVGVVDDSDRRLSRNSCFSSQNSSCPLSLITLSLNDYK